MSPQLLSSIYFMVVISEVNWAPSRQDSVAVALNFPENENGRQDVCRHSTFCDIFVVILCNILTYDCRGVIKV